MARLRNNAPRDGLVRSEGDVEREERLAAEGDEQIRYTTTKYSGSQTNEIPFTVGFVPSNLPTSIDLSTSRTTL